MSVKQPLNNYKQYLVARVHESGYEELRDCASNINTYIQETNNCKIKILVNLMLPSMFSIEAAISHLTKSACLPLLTKIIYIPRCGECEEPSQGKSKRLKFKN